MKRETTIALCFSAFCFAMGSAALFTISMLLWRHTDISLDSMIVAIILMIMALVQTIILFCCTYFGRGNVCQCSEIKIEEEISMESINVEQFGKQNKKIQCDL